MTRLQSGTPGGGERGSRSSRHQTRHAVETSQRNAVHPFMISYHPPRYSCQLTLKWTRRWWQLSEWSTSLLRRMSIKTTRVIFLENFASYIFLIVEILQRRWTNFERLFGRIDWAKFDLMDRVMRVLNISENE